VTSRLTQFFKKLLEKLSKQEATTINLLSTSGQLTNGATSRLTWLKNKKTVRKIIKTKNNNNQPAKYRWPTHQ